LATATTVVDPPFSRAVISLACWQAAQGAVKQSIEIKQSTRSACGRRVGEKPGDWREDGQARKGAQHTEAVLVLETILGSDTSTDDPVRVALAEAIADGALREEKRTELGQRRDGEGTGAQRNTCNPFPDVHSRPSTRARLTAVKLMNHKHKEIRRVRKTTAGTRGDTVYVCVWGRQTETFNQLCWERTSKE